MSEAVGRAVESGSFEDPEWVGRWDATFAGMCLSALDALLAGDADSVPRPWRLAFAADPSLPPLRQKVWANVGQLQAARAVGGDALRTRNAELEVLSAARIADLLAPGQVLLRLAVSGFGVVLPPP